MPLVRIDVIAPKSPEYKRSLLTGVRAAVTGAFGVDDGRVSLRVIETRDDDVDLPSCRTERLTIIEVLMYEGRTPEMKSAMATAAREALAADPGIEPSEVQIAFREFSKTDLDVPAGEAEGARQRAPIGG
jgi:phenylpyruvate tautomerase PptA (4-oxalocrotonate tautomerase family)